MKKLIPQLKTFILLLLLLFLCSGCYDPKELDDFAYVIAIGIDKGEEKDLKITFQIAIPIKISGDGNSTGKETSTLITLESNSLYEALSQANTKISKEMNLSQNEVVVFSEELSREGLRGYINPFVTNREVRPRTSVIVSKSSAKDFLASITPVLETNPSRYLDLMIQAHSYSGYSVGTELVDFYWNAQSKYVEPIAILADLGKQKENETTDKSKQSSGQKQEEGNSEQEGGSSSSSDSSSKNKVEEDPTPNFSGIAVFSGTKMVGEFTKENVIPHLILINSLRPVNFEIPDIKEPDKTTIVTLRQRIKPKFTLKLNKDIPNIRVEANIHAQLITNGSPVDYFEKSNRYKLAKKIEEKLTKLIYSYLDKTTKEFQSDITGFGKLLKPQYLTTEELEKINWHEIYPNSQFSVKVNIDLDTSQIVSYTEKVQTKKDAEEN